jgi:FecR-like protein
MPRFRSVLFVLAALCGVLASPAWSAGEAAGRVEKLSGTVEAVAADQPPRRLAAGATIASGERIQVGADSNVTLRFRDESVFDIGPRGVLVVDRFEIGKNPEESNFATRILKGSFRFVTGLIARNKPSSMRVGLTVATIGIRGTHVVGEVDDTSAKVILLEPEDNPKRSTSIEVANQFGKVVVDKPGYGTEIPDQFSPPSPVRRMQVRQIEDMLRAIRSSAMRTIPPRPR